MYPNVLVPIDGSETSNSGLVEAIKLAEALGSKIRLYHVVKEYLMYSGYGIETSSGETLQAMRDAGQQVIREAARLVGLRHIPSDTVVEESIEATASRLIVKQAGDWPADLIVMGTHGRRGLSRLALGSDAQWVVQHVRIPVLLVHGTAINTVEEVRRQQSTNSAAHSLLV